MVDVIYKKTLCYYIFVVTLSRKNKNSLKSHYCTPLNFYISLSSCEIKFFWTFPDTYKIFTVVRLGIRTHTVLASVFQTWWRFRVIKNAHDPRRNDESLSFFFFLIRESLSFTLRKKQVHFLSRNYINHWANTRTRTLKTLHKIIDASCVWLTSTQPRYSLLQQKIVKSLGTDRMTDYIVLLVLCLVPLT